MCGPTSSSSPGSSPGDVAALHVEPRGRVALLRVIGELDISTEDHLAGALTVALALTESLLLVELADCSFVGLQPFEAIERAACVLHDRGAQLAVRMPPPSYVLIRAHAPPGRALVIARPPPCWAPGRVRWSGPGGR